MNDPEINLLRLCELLAEALLSSGLKCVFAESCSGGRMAAAMTSVPGISTCFCGSAVTYRESTKTAWLSVDNNLLRSHTAESTFASESLARNVLSITSEADVSLAVTGHLGPNVDESVDGKIFVAIGARTGESVSIECSEHQLQRGSRRDRQCESACLAIGRLIEFLRHRE